MSSAVSTSDFSFLVTNDDGVASPLFQTFLETLNALAWCGELRPVVPRDEQSWVAQTITRFRPLHVTQGDVKGISAHIVDGSPADCASLGITELYPNRPDFLISGINIGTNESLAFYLNSGTVGGARQGIVFGCRSIAVSMKLPQEIFSKWRSGDIAAIEALQEDWKRGSRAACRVISQLLNDQCWHGVDLYSINMPWGVNEETPVKVTHLERATYPSIFHPIEEGRFRHRLDALTREDEAMRTARAAKAQGTLSDMEAIEKGSISLSPIYYDLLPREERLLSALASQFPNSLAK